MDSEDLTTAEPPVSIDPYAILSLPASATGIEIRSAYRKFALKTHPDKVSPDQRKAAHVKFQELALAYAVLSDEKRRAQYDRTGSTAETLEDDDGFDWSDFFRSQYAEHVTANKIAELRRTYQGSVEEREDVLKAYRQGEGSLDKVFEEVMLSNVNDDEDRIRAYIDEAITSGLVPSYERYAHESPTKRRARRKRARKEQDEAEEAAKEMGLHEEVFGGLTTNPDISFEKEAKVEKSPLKPRPSKRRATNGTDTDLAALIQQRHAGRAEAFFDNLEAKYGGGSNGKKRKVDEPGEEEFAAMAQRGRRAKDKLVTSESNDNISISNESQSKRSRTRKQVMETK